MKKLAFLPIVLALLLSCSNDDEGSDPQPFEPYDVAYTLVAKGSLYGNSAEGISELALVITNDISWLDLMEAINSYNDHSHQFEETEIDFNDYQLLVAFEEVKPNGGWSIDIMKVTEQELQIEVKIENLQTGNLASVHTQPFHIIKILKSDKPVVFERIYPED